METLSLEELPTKAKEDPSPHEMALFLLLLLSLLSLLLFIYSLLTKKGFT